MKKNLFVMLAVLLALPAMAQTVLRQDGMIFNLYVPEGGTPYAEVSGNLLTELTAVTIPSVVSKDGIDYSVTAIAEESFESCHYLTSVSIPNSVTTIGDDAFSECSGLTSVTIPNSVTDIGGAAFKHCIGLTSVTIPNSVTTIGSAAFSECSRLTSVNIPNSVTDIGASAFYGCSAMTSVNIPGSVTYIGPYTFVSCSGLTSVTIPNSVTYIGESAFEDCSGLTSVNIPASVTDIGAWAFRYCSGLTSVSIPSSVTSIGNYAFDGCDNLVEVNYDTTEPVSADKDLFSDGTYKTATLNVAKGGLNKAQNTEPWMYFVDIKEKDFAGIEEVITDFDPNAPVEVYNLSGEKVADNVDNLPSGLYIIRQDKTTKKVAVK